MNSVASCLRRLAYRLRRLGHHHGYGVHSPWAFEYINRVILERAPYYAYAELHRQLADNPDLSAICPVHEPAKVCRLLLRIVNRAQPVSIVDVGPKSVGEHYLRAGKRGVAYTYYNMGGTSQAPAPGQASTLLYVHDVDHPQAVEDALLAFLPFVDPATTFLVYGIGHNAAMATLWRRFIERPEVGVSFDLYDIGIAFFDPTKMKRNYIVNF